MRMNRFPTTLIAALFVLGWVSLSQAASIISDDFESYSHGTWPSTWTPLWNASGDTTNNIIAADPTNPSNKTLKLYGVVGNSAEARYYTGNLPNAFTAEVKVYNGSESQGNWGRGSLSIPGHMTLFNFFPDGLYGANGFLSTCHTEQWYDMKVSYQRQGSNVTTDYWVDGVYNGQQQTDISAWLSSGLAADHIALNSGGTAYYDDVRLRAVPPLQTVVLDWDTPAPVRISTTKVELPFFDYKTLTDQETPAAIFSSDKFMPDVLAKVEQIFSESNVTENIRFTTTRTPGAEETVIYFADYHPGLGGRAYTGIDPGNQNLSGEAIIFKNGNSSENVARAVAHELGHLLGLIHVAPGGDEIMEPSLNMNADSFIDTQSWSGLHTHNPVYHLKRYVEGMSHGELVQQGTIPGTYDTVLTKIITSINLEEDVQLYDVRITAGSDADALIEIAYFEEISAADLSAQEFDVPAGLPFQMIASSASGIESDVALSSDGMSLASIMMQPVDGEIPASLLVISDADPEGYVVLTCSSNYLI